MRFFMFGKSAENRELLIANIAFMGLVARMRSHMSIVSARRSQQLPANIALFTERLRTAGTRIIVFHRFHMNLYVVFQNRFAVKLLITDGATVTFASSARIITFRIVRRFRFRHFITNIIIINGFRRQFFLRNLFFCVLFRFRLLLFLVEVIVAFLIGIVIIIIIVVERVKLAIGQVELGRRLNPWMFPPEMFLGIGRILEKKFLNLRHDNFVLTYFERFKTNVTLVRLVFRVRQLVPQQQAQFPKLLIARLASESLLSVVLLGVFIQSVFVRELFATDLARVLAVSLAVLLEIVLVIERFAAEAFVRPIIVVATNVSVQHFRGTELLSALVALVRTIARMNRGVIAQSFSARKYFQTNVAAVTILRLRFLRLYEKTLNFNNILDII